MEKLTEYAKLLISACAALAFVGTVYTGFVTMVGGRVVPWLSVAETQHLIDANVMGLREESDRRECEDYRNRLSRARAALGRDNSDMVAHDLESASLAKIKTIQGCAI